MRRAVRRLRTALGGIQLPGVPAVGPLRAAGVDEGMTLTFGSTRIQIAAAGERLVIAIGPGALADALHPAAEARRRAEVQGRGGAARRRT